ncbi:ribokinase [Paenibacillus flagellatus]|uniref:Ribokinase n=1 Tax=Paenibacillus flagellatus TaxID=2211139 RepID=A0A2V5K707_9BACL|nr:ribokinase [Paenibacillus flagellatus]PYI54622.1 ribokinase [Paenibacillus flagellatus]
MGAGSRAKIVVAGSINMDLVVTSAKSPVPGETIMGEGFAMIPGGKGANQAVAAARLGADVTMIGRVGDDLFGVRMIEQLRAEGVDTSCVLIEAGVSTGVALIQVLADGDNSIVVVPGANALVAPEQVEAAEERIREADVLLVQLEIPLPAVEAALRLARKHGVRTILNPAPARKLPEELLRTIDALTPNETEAAILATGTVEGAGTLDERLDALRAIAGDAALLVTVGGKGVRTDIGGKRNAFPAYDVDVVDTTAAGDSFNAAIAVRLGEGAGFDEAIRFASKTGALTVTRFGAQSSLPTRAEVERFEARERE